MIFRRRRVAPPELPEGRLVAITYDIPQAFGGLTKAMLQRSAFFGEVTRRPVEILTVATDLDPVATTQRLRDRGILGDTVSLRNLWAELVHWSDDALRAIVTDPAAGTPTGGHEIRRPDGTVLARLAWVSAGRRVPVTPHGDHPVGVWLYDSSGELLGGWRGVWPLWRHWLTSELAGEPTFAIIDSASVAEGVLGLDLPQCATAVVVHNNHVNGSYPPPYGLIERWRSHLFAHLDDIDALVFLTGAQRADAERWFGPLDRAHVVPNARRATPTGRVKRDEKRGIMLASLDGRKRVDHAVRAVAKASSGVHLDVFGKGPRKRSLENLADDLGATVRLPGYTSEAEREFAASSFSLLTSTREGLPLVLAEAMASGCVPIAYDIAYGPAEVITHGVDGYLVPAGDVTAMAATIDEFVGLPARKRKAMREAARARARDFEPEPVIARWADVWRSTSPRALAPTLDELAHEETLAVVRRFGEPALRTTLTHVTWDGPVADLTLRLDVDAPPDALGPLWRGTPALRAWAVRRPTGERTELEVLADDTDASIVRWDVSAADDHVLVLEFGDDDLTLVDLVRDVDCDLRRSPAPDQPVLLADPDTGLGVVMARPRAAASAVVDGDVVRLGPRVLVGSALGELEVRGPKGARVDGTSVEFTGTGRWALRVRVDGTARDLAAEGPLTSDPLDLVRCDTTPRGYLRVERRSGRATVGGFATAGLATWLTGRHRGDGVPLVRGHEHLPVTVLDGRWELAVTDLPTGSHRLGWRADAVIDPTLDPALAAGGVERSSVQPDGRRYTLRRRFRRAWPELVIEDLRG